MKKLGAFTAAVLVVAPLALRAQATSEGEGYYDRSFARMSYVRGDVSVQRASDQGFEPGEINLPLVQGDKLGVKDGRTEVHFGKSNYLRLDADTQLDLNRMPQRDGDPVSLHLLSGRAYLRVASLDREKAFEVHTPDASFYVLDRGLYRFEVSPSRETEVYVLEGALEAAGEAGSVEVDRNERVVAVNGEVRSRDGGYLSVSDDFSEWNADRDEVHRPRATTRYLPAEIDEYQDEFDTHGRWTYERPYGYVWVPSVYEADWRPYYHGRWVWYPIVGWTWVSYEPWGWAAYHYGRWHWRLGLGWYWIPTRHWGPAWVHWWWDANYYGWCPLGWYNRPIIIVHNHFYHHDHGRDYPRHSRALTVVRRDQLQSRQISRAALRADRVESEVRNVSLRARQPDLKPVVNRAGLEQRAGAKILSRENLRGVVRSYAPGEVRADRPRLSDGVRGREALGSVERSGLGKRSSGAEPRVLRDEERAVTPRAPSPREFKTYPSRRLDVSPNRSSRDGRSDIAPAPGRTATSSDERSGLIVRRDASSQSVEPREFASRLSLSRRVSEPSSSRSSSGSFSDVLRTFRSRLLGSESRSEARSSDDAPVRRYENRSDSESDVSRYSRSYDSPSRQSSSRSSSYSSPRSSRSSSSSSRSSVSSRSSGSRSSSSPSRSSGSSSRSGSSGSIRKK
ncbi:MAG: FecR domain-containing protein [Candidatus Aminicenantes bacterium]|nr:FecR domain-containing protein [Candidatus Aminicenantes bacterium]